MLSASSTKGIAMFKTIVWATDGTEFADRALPLVRELAHANNARVVAVHANELMLGRLGSAPLLADEEDLESRLTAQVAELRHAGLAAELKIRTGARAGAAELVAEAAADVHADLIVLATHAHLLGSVAKALLAKATCPVLVLPPHAVEVVEPELAVVTTT
jgi:nucleotide-binding universal stress UspA family protein